MCSPDTALLFFRVWANTSALFTMGRPWTYCCCGLRLPWSSVHHLCDTRFHQVPWYTSCEILQPGALLHHPSWHLSGLPMHFLPHRKATCSVLLSTKTGHRPFPCYELLRSGHQDQSHCSYLGWQQEKNLYQEAPFHECLCPVDHSFHPYSPATSHHSGTVHHGSTSGDLWLPINSWGAPYL